MFSYPLLIPPAANTGRPSDFGPTQDSVDDADGPRSVLKNRSRSKGSALGNRGSSETEGSSPFLGVGSCDSLRVPPTTLQRESYNGLLRPQASRFEEPEANARIKWGRSACERQEPSLVYRTTIRLESTS